jgi:hypothetical protein
MTTPLYAAIIGLVFVILSVRTLLLRRRLGIAIGTGEDPELTRAMRVHSNFAEYVPLALILFYFLEVETDADLWIHVLCVSLIVGRLLHAYGVSQVEENYRFRVAGMILTLGSIISASTRLIVSYVT